MRTTATLFYPLTLLIGILSGCSSRSDTAARASDSAPGDTSAVGTSRTGNSKTSTGNAAEGADDDDSTIYSSIGAAGAQQYSRPAAGAGGSKSSSAMAARSTGEGAVLSGDTNGGILSDTPDAAALTPDSGVAFDGGATSDAGSDSGVTPDAEADAATDGRSPDAVCALLDRSKPLVLYQSADDSNSMASPAIARRLINLGRSVPPNLIRTYEFLNYYRIRYEPAPASHVRVVPQLRADPEEGKFTLQIGIQSEAAPSPRRPMNITFVLDNSGSMTGDPIEIEKAAVLAIAASMRAGDRVSMVTWNTQNRVLLDGLVVDGPNDPSLLDAVKLLNADGATDLSGGLSQGYALAQKYYQQGQLNRVVLISDGQANTGVTDEQLIGNASHSEDQEGIYLVGVSVGDGTNDTLMNVVTDKGRGAYVYLDGAQEADLMLHQRFDETMEVAARGVRLELTVPWYFGMVAFSGEQSSTVAAEVEPQHLAPDDAMVFHEKFSACSASMVNLHDTVSARATYETPITHVLSEDSATATLGELLSGSTAALQKGGAIVAYAEALKSGSSTRAKKLDEALAAVELANQGGTDPELSEIAELIRRYRSASP